MGFELTTLVGIGTDCTSYHDHDGLYIIIELDLVRNIAEILFDELKAIINRSILL